MPDVETDPLEQAKQRGYLRSKDLEARNQWYCWCERHDEPYLTVDDGPLYATVRLDTVTCKNRALTREGAHRIRLILWRHTVPYHAADPWVDVRGGTGAPSFGAAIWCERISHGRADYVAGEVAKIVRQEMVEWRGEGTFAEYVPVEG